MNWVWLKRDLRLHDHAPLIRALDSGPSTVVFLVEPSLLAAPDMDAQHWDWIAASLTEVALECGKKGIPFRVLRGEAVDVFQPLLKADPDFHLWSHMETGVERGFARDRAVQRLVASYGRTWTEIPQQAVVRGLRNRDQWQDHWTEFMSQTVLPAPSPQGPPVAPEGRIPSSQDLGLALYHPAVSLREPDILPGEREGRGRLREFLRTRGARYHREMSSPVTAWESCSRLSPFLSWGNLSIREVLRKTREARIWHMERKKGKVPGAFPKAALSAFESRLHWHCHFIQKLESEPRIESHAFHPGFDDLRSDLNQEGYHAWIEGRTGYPMVDACMRALQTRGWINFRMRAMLVSFAAYDLWIDWRVLRDPLARQFLDYEPGIHISQLQMQSGVTGINTLRMYNPVKQGLDHDPDGVFLRAWLPELEAVPLEGLHEPWKLSARERNGYPLPVVDHLEACREARKRISALRKRPEIQKQARLVQERHGSRTFRSGHRSVTSSVKTRRLETIPLPLEDTET